MLQKIIDGFENFAACLWAYNRYKEEFWEWLSMGWYDEYIYPYDDIYGVYGLGSVSEERILRLGENYPQKAMRFEEVIQQMRPQE